jgi:hypothetical protein
MGHPTVKLKILRETTNFTKVEYTVPKHDYLVEGGHGGRLIAYRKEGCDVWEKFSKMAPFSKKHRSFKELREEVPVEFVTPVAANPWDNRSYNSLEAFMS